MLNLLSFLAILNIKKKIFLIYLKTLWSTKKKIFFAIFYRAWFRDGILELIVALQLYRNHHFKISLKHDFKEIRLKVSQPDKEHLIMISITAFSSCLFSIKIHPNKKRMEPTKKITKWCKKYSRLISQNDFIMICCCIFFILI